MNHASGKDYDPSAWAKQRQERIKRAFQLRRKRQSGSPDENHTFKPHLLASTDGVDSKLPLGARTGDATVLTQGTYDLSVLDTMEEAYPPKRTSVNIYRDGIGRKNSGSNIKASLSAHRHNDSLDSLAVSTSDRCDHESMRSSPTRHATASSPQVGSESVEAFDKRQRGTAEALRTGRTMERNTFDGFHDDRGSREEFHTRRRNAGADALTQELEQRPHVRGNVSDAPAERSSTSTRDGRRYQRHNCEGVAAVDRDGNSRISPYDGPLETVAANDAYFTESLRTVEPRAVARAEGGAARRAGRRQSKRPEWSSDTAGVGWLGDPQARIVTDNSPAAVQSRLDAKQRDMSEFANVSPYATADGPSGAIGSSNGNGNGSGGSSSRIRSGTTTSTAWRHKHTRSLPWGEDMSSATGAEQRGTQPGGMEEIGWSEISASRRAPDGLAAPRARKGYRRQVMPSRTSRKLSEVDNEIGGNPPGDVSEAPGDDALLMSSDRLRQNLSLLKKKMHSQAGGRRSQSAGPRAGELSGNPLEDDDAHQQAGRDRLHATTGTAPATIPVRSGPFRDNRGRRIRDATVEEQEMLGGRNECAAVPAPEGPGSPYAVDPNPRRHATRGGSSRLEGPSRRGRHHEGRQRDDSGTYRPHDGETRDIVRVQHGHALSRRLGDGSHRKRRLADDVRTAEYPGVASGARGGAPVEAAYHRSERGNRQDIDVHDTCDRRRAWGVQEGGGERLLEHGAAGVFAPNLPEDAFPAQDVELRKCTACGRRFNPDALARHARACRSVFQAKRKVFNASAMRIKGTELEKFATWKGRAESTGRGRCRAKGSLRSFDDTPVGGGKGSAPSKWRQQSSQFREAIRQARVVTNAQLAGTSLADLPPPKPSAPDPSLVPCPHCGRRFNQTAGERHMQHCKNIRAKPSALKKGSGSLLGHAARKSSAPGGRGQRW